MLLVAAEQLVGALSRERDGDVARGELGEREEAERGEVGERLVEVPGELGELDCGSSGAARARGGRRRQGRDRRASSSSMSWPVEADGERLDGSSCRGHERDDEAESRPPLSIAPSGTSLISRMRTDSLEQLEHALRRPPRRNRRGSDGQGPGSSSRRSTTTPAVVDHEALAGQELADALQRRPGAGTKPKVR